MISPAFDREEYDLYFRKVSGEILKAKKYMKADPLSCRNEILANGGTSSCFPEKKEQVFLICSKRSNACTERWKREDLDFMTSQQQISQRKIYVPGECGR